MCYAFRDHGCEETMEMHVRGVVGLCRERWELEGLVTKVSRLIDIGLSRDETKRLVKEFIIFAAFLHDIGKCDRRYQEVCSRGVCTSFPEHDLLSARFALTVAFNTGIIEGEFAGRVMKEKLHRMFAKGEMPSDVGDLYLILVVVPIMFHHYAQKRSYGYQKRGRVFRESVRSISMPSGRFEIYEGCIEPMRKVLRELYTVETTNYIQKLLREVENMVMHGAELSVIDEKIYGGEYSWSFAKYLAEAVIGLLNMCDGRVAVMNRRTCRETESITI